MVRAYSTGRVRSHMSSGREFASILSKGLIKAELLHCSLKLKATNLVHLCPFASTCKHFSKGSGSLPKLTGHTVTTANLCSHSVRVLMTVCNNGGIGLLPESSP